MKRITLSLVAFLIMNSTIIFAQSYSTGVVELSSFLGYTAEIDVTASEVTLTLTGPDNRWMGLGFGESCMVTDGDVVIFDGTTLSNRTFVGVGTIPPLDANDTEWNITSNIENGGVRTVIATRDLSTSNANDYVFTTAEDPITLVWAMGSSNTIASHGGNRGATTSGFTLGVDDRLLVEGFKTYPNPAEALVHIDLPQEITKGMVMIYDYTGKRVLKEPITALKNTVNISSLQLGMYLLHFETAKGSVTKRIQKI